MIRGLKRKPMALIKRIRKSKAEATGEDKPVVIKTHLRNMIIVPEMIGGVVGIHSGKTFNQVEIKVKFKLIPFAVILMSSCFQFIYYIIFCSLKHSNNFTLSLPLSHSHYHHFSPKWSVITSVNSPCLTKSLDTVVPVSVLLVLPNSYPSSKTIGILGSFWTTLTSL